MYIYYSLKQLESDILDLGTAISKINNAGIEVNTVDINMKDEDYAKLIVEFNERMTAYATEHEHDVESEKQVEQQLSPNSAGMRLNFAGINVHIHKVAGEWVKQESTPTVGMNTGIL